MQDQNLLQNKARLLLECVKFYANRDRYGTEATILIDEGEHARAVLEIIKNIDQEMLDAEKYYEKNEQLLTDSENELKSLFEDLDDLKTIK